MLNTISLLHDYIIISTLKVEQRKSYGEIDAWIRNDGQRRDQMAVTNVSDILICVEIAVGRLRCSEMNKIGKNVKDKLQDQSFASGRIKRKFIKRNWQTAAGESFLQMERTF